MTTRQVTETNAQKKVWNARLAAHLRARSAPWWVYEEIHYRRETNPPDYGRWWRKRIRTPRDFCWHLEATVDALGTLGLEWRKDARWVHVERPWPPGGVFQALENGTQATVATALVRAIIDLLDMEEASGSAK